MSGSGIVKRILIVDDEPEISEVLKERLNGLGTLKIDIAQDGQQAFNSCISTFKEGLPYHIVITDLTMPKMDGLSLLNKLRAHSHYKKIPIVLISGHFDLDNVKMATQYKPKEIICKPFQFDDFDQRLLKLINE